MSLRERMARFGQADLYVVITEAFCAGRPSLVVLDAVLDAGVRLVQLREKELDTRSLYDLAAAFREKTAAAGALFIVDDRVDIALAAGADGVHLGLDDLPVDAARRIAPDLIIGVSSHDLDQALAAQQAGASYINIGPIFPTRTKSVLTGAVGPEMISAVAPHLTIPWTTMGGIKVDNVHEVLKRGARRVAVMTAVTAAENFREAARALRETILEYR